MWWHNDMISNFSYLRTLNIGTTNAELLTGMLPLTVFTLYIFLAQIIANKREL